MNKIIIHISDLHVSDQRGKLGPVNTNTYYTLDETENLNYTNQFLDKVKGIPQQDRYLVITGDFSNIAEKLEFSEATKIVKNIMTQLGINKDKVLLIPGDHEIHRDSIKDAIRDDIPEDEYQKIKFANFNALYYEIKEDNFPWDKLIFDHIEIGDLILLGVNSNYQVDQTGGNGFLPTKEFEIELASIRERYPKQELILCLHHNLEGEHELKSYGQWDARNKLHLITIFTRYNIKCILNGNEHTPNSKYLGVNKDIIISDAGPISSKITPAPSFKIYEIEDSGSSLALLNRVFGLRTVNGQSEGNYGNWVEYRNEEIKNSEIERFVFRNQAEIVIEEPENSIPGGQTVVASEEETTLVTDENSGVIKENSTDDVEKVEEEKEIKEENSEKPEEAEEEPETVVTSPSPTIVYENDLYQGTLYGIIRDKKLFHQGHFHWSETSRAHNWIDTTRLLEDKDDLHFVNKAIIDVLETMNLIENTDLIIGLGYEGNMIASKASLKYNLPYTYLPYSYRWDDYNEFENRLHFENEEKEFKQVILITDVVNDGRTIRKLVGKENREKKFFDNVEKIIVVSLFYTGHENLNNDILNYDRLSEDRQKGDEVVNNIEYYTVQQLKIEKCPYGENYKSECFILRDNLHCIHKFYTEK